MGVCFILLLSWVEGEKQSSRLCADTQAERDILPHPFGGRDLLITFALDKI
jgi:hypothetical protein